jgi:hypothetical protein
MARMYHSNYSNLIPVSTHYAPQEPNIYCPVCRIEYPQSQTDSHIMRHTIQNVKFAEKREDDHAVSTQYSKNSFTYPLIEPLEFSTSELTPVNRRNILKFERQEKNKRVPRVI